MYPTRQAESEDAEMAQSIMIQDIYIGAVPRANAQRFAAPGSNPVARSNQTQKEENV